MSAVATEGRAAGGLPLGRLIRFVMVGGVSTLIYAVGAVLLTRMSNGAVTPGAASVVAYLTGAVFSYTAHKLFTFRSDGAHAIAVPRFAASTAFGLSLSWGLAVVLSSHFGLPIEVPVVLASILVPVMNYLLLSRWVFAGPGR